MVSDDERIKQKVRAVSDNDLLRPRKIDDDSSKASSPVVAFDDTASNGGIRSKRSHSAAAPAPAPAGAVAAGGPGGKTPKPPGWGKKTKAARGLFFRSGGTPKTQDGESPPVPARGSALGKGLASAAAAGSSVARKTLRTEST